MFHCHNLVHEDHDMMAAFNVTDVDLTDYGYPETTKFSDPMSPLFAAKKYTGSEIGQIHDVLLPYFQNLDAYPNPEAVEKALDDYYKDDKKKTSSTYPSTSSPTSVATLSTVTTSKPPSKTTSKAPTTTTACEKQKGRCK